MPQGNEPLRAYANYARAEAELQRQEQEARTEILQNEDEYGLTANLGRTFGTLEAMTSLSARELEQQVAALGLPPFPHIPSSYASYTDYGDEAWWDKSWRILGKNKAESLWALFDRIHFFELVEVELPPRFLVRPRWALLEEMQKRGLEINFPFENRTDAERFAAENYPLEINPFVLAQDEEDGNLVFWLTQGDFEVGEDDSPSIPLTELESRVAALGLPPFIPTGHWAGETWELWWARNQSQMTADEKRALWQLLIPKPYEIILLEVQE